MGNDQSCCDNLQQRGYIQSNINSLKYASIIHTAQSSHHLSKFKNSKNVFTGNNLQNVNASKPSSKISQSKLDQIDPLLQNNQSKSHSSSSQIEIPFKQDLSKSKIIKHTPKQSQLLKSKAHSEIINNPQKAPSVCRNPVIEENRERLQQQDQSESSYQNVFNNSQPQKSELYRHSINSQMPVNNKSKSVQSRKHLGSEQIVIEYLPIIRSIIERQKPFEQELVSIPKSKIITKKLNNFRDVYKGQINYYEKPHGYGVLVKQNGNTLIGQFDNGNANGKAYYIFTDGSYYKGEMINSQANDDKGELLSKKMTFIGGFKNNLFHGIGKQLGNDYFYQGKYSKHLKQQGVLKWQIKKSTIKMNRNSIQHETDVPPIRDFQNLPTYEYLYQGSFDENQRFTGIGKLIDPYGEYEGDFNQGKKHGKGTYMYDNNLKYVGEYRNNIKQGFGKLYNCDNTMAYEGFWKNNLPDGKGNSFDFEGNRYSLQFVQGISTILAPQ